MSPPIYSWGKEPQKASLICSVSHKASTWQGQNFTQGAITPRLHGSFPRACYYHDTNSIAVAHMSGAHYSLPILQFYLILKS